MSSLEGREGGRGQKRSGSSTKYSDTVLVGYSDTAYSDKLLKVTLSHFPNDWFVNELRLLTVTVG